LRHDTEFNEFNRLRRREDLSASTQRAECHLLFKETYSLLIGAKIANKAL
jgi:hypothetical protein